MSIGERISELRKSQNISQVQLAEALSITRQAVSKWENDQAVPDALKMIQLADLLDTDIEYLSTGRRNFSRRPPVVLNEVKIVEKIVEKPVVTVKTVEVEKIVEVPTVQYVEKPVIKKVYRTKYTRNPIELLVVGSICFIIGLIVGLLI
ncbi:MAG: helix-turn-helix transcriptional regulator [Oscillospiraceae bacterium]